VVWLKIGKLQKLLLFLLLEEDNPLGRYIPIWIAVQREFKLTYETYCSKKKQKIFFEEERKIRHAYERLIARGFVVSLWSTLSGFSWVPLDGRACDFCILTQEGRLVAEWLKHQEQILQEEEAVVKRVFDRVCALGEDFVMFEHILEFLWMDSFHEFGGDRGAFDRYWNGTKLGKVLKRCGVSRSRISRVDGRIRYCVKSAKVGSFDDVALG
jgi:hypothetical protein